MIFSAEFEFALRASALAIVMVAWTVTRLLVGLPVLHPWLGAIAAGLFSAITLALTVVPGSGPGPEIVANASGILTGLAFTAGTRFEATNIRLGARGCWLLVGASVAVAVVLQVGAGDPVLRRAILQLLVGLAMFASLIWVPSLLRRDGARLGAACLGIFAIGIVIDRAMPLLQKLGSGGEVSIFPYIEHSDIIAVIAGGCAMIVFSVERARRDQAQLVSSRASR